MKNELNSILIEGTIVESNHHSITVENENHGTKRKFFVTPKMPNTIRTIEDAHHLGTGKVRVVGITGKVTNGMVEIEADHIELKPIKENT